MPGQIAITLPTKGSKPSLSKAPGERFPVVFILPRDLAAAGKPVGGMKIRIDLASERSYDPSSPFCDALIDQGEVELFVITERRRKASVTVDSEGLARALAAWKDGRGSMRPTPPSDTPARSSAVEAWNSFEGRCSMAKRRSEDIEAEKKSKKGGR